MGKGRLSGLLHKTLLTTNWKWRLCKAHQHPEPLKLTLVGNKGRVVGRNGLEWDVVEAGYQV